MDEVDICPGCGIPLQIIETHTWLNNGVIILKGDPQLRMTFVEVENLDPLFDGIEKIIGAPIEHLIIDAERRGCRDYFDPLIPREVKDMIQSRELPLDPIIDAMTLMSKLNGIGRFKLVEYNHEQSEDNFITLISYDCHSLPLTCGDVAGGSEAVVEMEHSNVTHREVSPGVHEITAAVSGSPEELAGRLKRKDYHKREGDVELERCSSCGGPAAFSKFNWKLDRGIIINQTTGRRIGIVHPSVLDPIFSELEQELGETIPRVVVEAQRRFTRTGFYSIEELSDEGDFRAQLALRGMGNLRNLSMDKKGLHLHLDDACMHLMVVGMVQGVFELAFDVDSEVEWELSQEGDLQVEVSPIRYTSEPLKQLRHA